jgi:hypothetical protein
MFDLLAAAERCRFKACQCEQSAKNTTSAPFAQCYLQLAKLLVSTADLEEDFVRRDLAATQGNLRREPKVSAAERANRLQNYLMS